MIRIRGLQRIVNQLKDQVKQEYKTIILGNGKQIEVTSHDIMEVFHELLQAEREDREPEHELIDKGILQAKQIPENGLTSMVVALDRSKKNKE